MNRIIRCAALALVFSASNLTEVKAQSRGDVNTDGTINTADLAFLGNKMLGNGPDPVRACLSDVDASGATDGRDLFYLINYVAGGGTQPVQLAETCNGTDDDCNGTPDDGPIIAMCPHNEQCQDAACTSGQCVITNVNPGTQTCGVGICTNVVPQCANGQPNECTPLQPATETCNDVDDNCDGTIDNGPFMDSYESNDTANTVRQLTGVGSDQTNSYSSMTVYPVGDIDYYSVPLVETDNSCGCGSFSFDEDYELKVTLTVPTGAGAYELCMNVDSLGFPAGYCFSVAAGSSATRSMYIDGACGPGSTDSYTGYIRVRGLNAPAFECRPYTLSYFFDAGLCR